MPPIEKLKKFLEILDYLDDETLFLISKLSETKKQKLYDILHETESDNDDIKKLILKFF
jgi:restriction endonuclease S subunit